MWVALFGSFAISAIVSIFLWTFFSFGGVLQASEMMNWMGIFITTLSLTFAVYIVVLAIDAYSHLNAIRAARTDLRSIQDAQEVMQTALKTSEAGVVALKEEIKSLRKRQVEFALRLNTQVAESIQLPANSDAPQLKEKLIRDLQQASALLIMDSFPDDCDVVMPQIYALLEVGDVAALKKAKNWLAAADVRESRVLMEKLAARSAELEKSQ